MDSIDKALLLALEANCRLSYQALARQLGLSANAVKKRVNRLLETGIIERFVVELTLAMQDADLLLADILTDGSEDQEPFIMQMGKYPMIRNVNLFADGSYQIIAEVPGAQGMSAIGKFLRGLKSVTQVDLHSLIPAGGTPTSPSSQIVSRGKKVEFSSLQLRVLKCLIENPRMAVNDIAQSSGLTARRVRKVLNQLHEIGGVHFTVRWNWNAGGSTHVPFRLKWDDTKTSSETVIQQLHDEYPLRFWYAFLSVMEPLLFCVFIVDHIREVEEISRQIKRLPCIIQITTKVPFPTRIFPSLGEVQLKKMVEATSVNG
jgi:DNA-binding Lrp family transcriptional regulator